MKQQAVVIKEVCPHCGGALKFRGLLFIHICFQCVQCGHEILVGCIQPKQEKQSSEQ